MGDQYDVHLGLTQLLGEVGNCIHVEKIKRESFNAGLRAADSQIIRDALHFGTITSDQYKIARTKRPQPRTMLGNR